MSKSKPKANNQQQPSSSGVTPLYRVGPSQLTIQLTSPLTTPPVSPLMAPLASPLASVLATPFASPLVTPLKSPLKSQITELWEFWEVNNYTHKTAPVTRLLKKKNIHAIHHCHALYSTCTQHYIELHDQEQTTMWLWHQLKWHALTTTGQHDSHVMYTNLC